MSEREHPEVQRARERDHARRVVIDTSRFREQLAAARAAVERTRDERGIDSRHDSGADSGNLSEDEERELADRSR